MSRETEAAGELLASIIRSGFDLDDIETLIEDSHQQAKRRKIDQLKHCAKQLFASECDSIDFPQFNRLRYFLDSTLDLGLKSNPVDSPTVLIGKYIRTAFGLLLFLGTFYMLIGGIFSSSSITRTSWHLSGLQLLGLMVFLFVFEGLQMSIGLLRLKDPQALKSKYERAYHLHKLFRSEEGTRKFLAGRQLAVVTIVFLVAQITTCPIPEYFPWTTHTIPYWFSISIGWLFWEKGLAGALATLWLGQLPPQFIANKVPARFLSFFGMEVALKFAFLLDTLGLTIVGTWISNLIVSDEEAVPTSSKESYSQYHELHGFAGVSVKKEWHISRSTTQMYYTSTSHFGRKYTSPVTDDGLIVPNSLKNIRFDSHIITPDGNTRQARIQEYSQERGIDKSSFFQAGLPSIQPIQSNEIFVFETVIKYNDFHSCEDDILPILRPTKYVIFRVLFLEDPSELGTVTVMRYDLDPLSGSLTRAFERTLEGCKISNITTGAEQYSYSFIDHYPRVDSKYAISWSCRYD